MKENNFAETRSNAPQIWVTSDLHLGHDKDFIWEPRGFKSCAEMTEKILDNLNTFVQPQDDLWILGDLVLGGLESAQTFLPQIPGKVHVILGNHDTNRRREIYESMGWDCHYAYILKWYKYRFYLSHYPTITENLTKEYPTQALLGLHGHTHSKSKFYEDRPYCYNVALDAHDNKPCRIDLIVTDIYNKLQELNFFLTDS